jgi:crotonobetainyl-CoA:carnitine CoA-transferase CaiB-like acyl-CoA transferase
VFENEQVRHLGLAVPVKSSTLGDLEVQRVPVTLGRTPGSVRMPTPELGEHNDAILRDLGYGDADIARLRKEEVI